VDLVGPGPAYERWKKTPEYQQWLKDSGQLKKWTNRSPLVPRISSNERFVNGTKTAGEALPPSKPLTGRHRPAPGLRAGNDLIRIRSPDSLLKGVQPRGVLSWAVEHTASRDASCLRLPKDQRKLNGRRPPTRRLENRAALRTAACPLRSRSGRGTRSRRSSMPRLRAPTIYLRSARTCSRRRQHPRHRPSRHRAAKAVIADPLAAGERRGQRQSASRMRRPLPGAQPRIKDFDQNGIFGRALRWLVLFRRGPIAAAPTGCSPFRSGRRLDPRCTPRGTPTRAFMSAPRTDITVRDCRAWANVVGIEFPIPVHRCPGTTWSTNNRRHWSPPPARPLCDNRCDIRLHGNVVIATTARTFGERATWFRSSVRPRNLRCGS